jgi:hypothetical protein
MAAYRSSSNNIGKLNFQPILYKNSPQAHTKLEFDLLGVAKELVRYVLHLSQKKFEKKHFSSHRVPKQQTTNYLVSRSFRR